MPMKSADTAGLRRSLRRNLRHRHHPDAAMRVRKPRLNRKGRPERPDAAADPGSDQRLLLQNHLRQQDAQFQQAQAQASTGSTVSTAPSVSVASDTASRHYIFGRYFDDNDRSAADILATLYYSGVLGPQLPDAAAAAAVEHGHGHSHGSPPLSPCAGHAVLPVCDVALPSMQQTNIMLQSWRSECADKASPGPGSGTTVRVHVDADDDGLDDDLADDLDYGLHMTDEVYPLTPDLSFGSSSSARSSFSQPVAESVSAALPRWPVEVSAKAPVALPAVTPPAVTPPALGHLLSRPFATFEQSYFSTAAPVPLHRPAAMPSPPQSPTDVGRVYRRPHGPPLTPISPTPTPTSRKADRKKAASTMPKPHCNVKYETAELDFIMYQRCTKNRAWDDVTAAFNAALPRLRQYAEGEEEAGKAPAHLSGTPGSPSPPSSDRYRPRPERTTPGLQASYYRQRLALPLLDEAGRLVFDEQTGKQVFTEVMVRDDKSRRRRRRIGPNGTTSGTGTASSTAAKTDDTRVHLVLYFPERVAHYDYWFVTAEDKALARERAIERNRQRAQRGLPSWQPGSDDPETGILIRNKE